MWEAKSIGMRRKVIELHRRGMGSRLIHRETGLDLSTIKQWVRTYGYQGEGFFMERPRVREYGYAFREMVVRDVLENHLSLREVSARYGIRANHKAVYALMRRLVLKSLVKPKKYRSFRGEEGAAAPNILNRHFRAGAPDLKWVTDVTEFTVLWTRLYLSALLDLYNGEAVAYSVGGSPGMGLVMEMLDRALKARPGCRGVILHSDQGWQYRHRLYRERLGRAGIVRSMSRRGNCLDNACAENFFSLLKSEFLYLQKFSSVRQFLVELDRYMRYYNNVRIKTRLGTSPVRFRERNCI